MDLLNINETACLLVLVFTLICTYCMLVSIANNCEVLIVLLLIYCQTESVFVFHVKRYQ